MKLFIDADGCPVVDISVSAAKACGVGTVIITDTSHIIERDNAVTITVEKGADSADFKIANMIHPGDIVVTQDYGLAAMCLARGGIPNNQNGLIFTDGNIEKMLYTRYVSKEIRRAGGRTKGPKKRVKEQDEDFKRALDSLLKKSCTT